jgi:hypothetical protein
VNFTTKDSLGVLVIATGNYIRFVERLINSIEDYNTTYTNINYHIFSDQLKIDLQENSRIKLHNWPHLKWPHPTLMRYHAFDKYASQLESHKYLIYLDADMKMNTNLPSINVKKIFSVIHPGYKEKINKPFENNRNSTAYTPPDSRNVYVCGGVQGGSSESYLTAVRQMKKWIDSDLEKGIVARWHDESYWNKYVNQNIDQTVILGREYCWPEQWVTSKNPGKIIALKKNHTATRNNYSFKSKVRFLLSEVRMKLLRPRTY